MVSYMHVWVVWKEESGVVIHVNWTTRGGKFCEDFLLIGKAYRVLADSNERKCYGFPLAECTVLHIWSGRFVSMCLFMVTWRKFCIAKLSFFHLSKAFHLTSLFSDVCDGNSTEINRGGKGHLEVLSFFVFFVFNFDVFYKHTSIYWMEIPYAVSLQAEVFFIFSTKN